MIIAPKSPPSPLPAVRRRRPPLNGCALTDAELVKLWDPQTGLLIRNLVGHTRPVQYVEFAPDSRALVSSGSDVAIRIWDSKAGECVQCLHGHADAIFRSRLTPDCRELVSCSFDGTLKLWRVSPEPPDAPPKVEFKNVQTNLHKHISSFKLVWDLPVANGAKISVYHVLRRAIDKKNQSLLFSSEHGEFGKLVSVRPPVEYLEVKKLKPGQTYQ